jgi:hypothetical protein
MPLAVAIIVFRRDREHVRAAPLSSATLALISRNRCAVRSPPSSSVWVRCRANSLQSLYRFAAVAMILLIASQGALSQNIARPVPTNGQCSVPADPGWTSQERFVWQHVCAGKIADFNVGRDYGGDLDPKSSQGMPDSRILRSTFLETVLLDRKYREALTRLGVQIIGARFAETIELANAQIGHDLVLRRCLLDRGANLANLRSAYTIELSNSNVTGKLDLTGLQVNWLLLTGSNVSGNVEAYGLRVSQNLNVDTVELDYVDMGDGRIGGGLNLTGAKISGKLDIAGLQVGSNVKLGRGAQYKEKIDLFFGKVGGYLDLAGGTFHDDVDLTGTQIGGLLILGSAKHGSASWPRNPSLARSPSLTLRIVGAGVVQSRQDSWPDTLDLTGFTYRSLSTDEDPSKARGAAWFETWLSRQKTYTPEPYQQLATVLRNQGRPETADKILYAGKERERAHSQFLSYIALTASKWVIGYSYHLFRSLYWILGFIGLGTILLWISSEGHRISRHYSFVYGLGYSFDLLLPIIKLREKHYNIDLNGWIRYYFYFHKIMGYVLAGFLGAGLTGLMK